METKVLSLVSALMRGQGKKINFLPILGVHGVINIDPEVRHERKGYAGKKKDETT